MAFTTANDQPARDAQLYEILGSNNGTNFTSIKSGSIICNDTRFNTTTYTFTNTNSYTYYRLIFTNQCNSSETIFQIAEVQLFETALGIDDFGNQNKFALYPNPSKGIFSVKSNDAKPIDTITITDTLGKQIRQIQTNASSSEINLQGIASGVYFVQITSGSEIATKKIIIE